MADFVCSYGGVLFAVEQSSPGLNPQFAPASMKTVENQVVGTNRVITHYLGLGRRVYEFTLIAPGVDVLTDLEALQGPIARPLDQYPAVGGRVTQEGLTLEYVGPSNLYVATADYLQRILVRFKQAPPPVQAFAVSGATAPSNAVLSDAPTDLAAGSPTSSSLDLSWTDPNAAGEDDGTQIQRSPDGSTWRTIAVVPAGQTTYTDSGLASGTPYHYRVRVFSLVGYSDWSGSATGTTS